MTTKLHPSIVISTIDKSTVYVDGECKLFRASEEEAYEYASSVSDTLWAVQVSEQPAKPRPTRVWDEEGYDTY